MDTGDRGAIVDALNTIARALDERDWMLLDQLMHPDIEAYGQRGVDAVMATIRAHLDGCGPSQHLLGNHTVEIDRNQAASKSYARVFHQGAGERAHQFFECMGTYHDTWVRPETKWLLRYRRFDMYITRGDFDVLAPA